MSDLTIAARRLIARAHPSESRQVLWDVMAQLCDENELLAIALEDARDGYDDAREQIERLRESINTCPVIGCPRRALAGPPAEEPKE